MFKKLLRNKKGTAEIVGTALFLVILFFFFSNVFLFHNRVSREMDQVIADKMNSAVLLETTSGSGNLVNCTGNPIFGGFAAFQSASQPPTGPPYTVGPPYGKIMSGTGGGTDSYIDTRAQDGKYQVLTETGKIETTDVAECKNTNLDYICLNATYQFNVTITKPEDLRLIKAITISFYGRSYETEGEAVDVYLYNVQRKTFENTGLKILDTVDWYNVTVPNPERYISLENPTKGIVKVNYLSDQNGFYCDEKQYCQLWIDFHSVSIGPMALKVSDLGGKDTRLVRLWITEVNTGNHLYIDFEEELDKEVWIAAGSYVNIIFGDRIDYDGKVLTINYKIPSGNVIFKVLNNLGNTATTQIEGIV